MDESRPHSGRMEGHGFYTEHSQAQQAYADHGLEWLARAAAEVEPPAAGLPFAIADLGAAGGGSSLAPMRRALAARRGDGPSLVVHTDIPSNDFSALFELVETSPDSYLGDDVFALAAGRSFYQRLLPDGFLSLAWSSIAVHWLSSVPMPIADHIYCSLASGEAREALRERSRLDWLDFLANRARELRPSGRMIVLGGAAADDGSSHAEGLMEAAEGSLRALVDAGDIAAAEYERMTIPTWNRTLAEFTAPFEAAEFAGELELRGSELFWLPDRYYDAYQRDGDLDRYVEAVVDFFCAAFEESLLAALDEGRSEDSVAAVSARFRAGLGERIAADPGAAACRWHVALLDIARL